VTPLPSSSVISVAFDSGNRKLLVGTERGLALLDVTRIGVRPSTPIDTAFAFPNPLRVLDGDEAMYIGGISEPAMVKVYNLEGELVWETTEPVVPVEAGNQPTGSFDEVAWDLRTLGGSADGFYAAAPGVYLVRIENSQGVKVTTITLIR
jgi:hypothetical protein